MRDVDMRWHDVLVLRRRRVEVNVGVDLDLVHMRHVAVHVVVRRRGLRRGRRDVDGRHRRHDPAGPQQRPPREVLLPLGRVRRVRLHFG